MRLDWFGNPTDGLSGQFMCQMFCFFTSNVRQKRDISFELMWTVRLIRLCQDVSRPQVREVRGGTTALEEEVGTGKIGQKALLKF